MGSLANAQNTSPASAIAPHTRSKAPIFHTAFGFLKRREHDGARHEAEHERHQRRETDMLLHFDAEAEDSLDSPKRPRDAIGRGLSAQRVADVAIGPERRQRDREVNELGGDHPSSLPADAVK